MKWQDLPIEIQNRMLECQEEQGNKRDPEKAFDIGSYGGFWWGETKEGAQFWHEVLINGNIPAFYDKYPFADIASISSPKVNTYPKVMLVWREGSAYKAKRVVFMEKRGKYLAWHAATTLEESERSTHVFVWDNAEDIPEFIEVTLSEVAKAMNIPVDKLRIKD